MPEKKLQLFILPFAGGNSTSFNKLEPLLDDRIETHTIEYPGRMTRSHEPFIESYDEFIVDAAEQINRLRLDLPFAIMGYSLGSTTVYDLVRQKYITGGDPVHAFLCARGSIFYKASSQKYADLSDEEFTDMIVSLGGIDDRILQNKRFLSIYMRPVKADYLLWKQFAYHEGTIPCDTSVLYSPKDRLSEGAHDWEKLVKGKTDYFELGENHFFILNHWQETADIINTHLEQYLQS